MANKQKIENMSVSDLILLKRYIERADIEEMHLRYNHSAGMFDKTKVKIEERLRDIIIDL